MHSVKSHIPNMVEYLSELARPTTKEDFTAAMIDALRNYHDCDQLRFEEYYL
jgi:hypothetical protein